MWCFSRNFELIFLSCSLAKEFSLARKEVGRLGEEFYSAAEESGLVTKEFG
ncbi:hypothetical protein [Candidatus Electronema sp. PJ]|uniref:hypothetical protein n=1 Tax=Candidatus Electronema sp. PJ TaxID=3401572 RepID=UPI003AA7C587